jgi:drug/metabolite transporter (DMT)-like permease
MALGLICALAAAGCYESGYMLQALEARIAPREEALRASLLMRLLARPRWLAGTALSIAGAALQLAALALAPVTLVQPVLALGLVLLLVLAHRVLGEHIGARELVGSAALIAGIVEIAIESPERSNGVTSILALVLIAAPLALLTLLPFALRSRAPLRLAMLAAAAGDSLAAIGLKLGADGAAVDRLGLAALAIAGAGAAGVLALTAEMSALRGLPASHVAPVVVAAQVIVPTVAAMTAFAEPVTAPLVFGVALAGAGAALLGSSGAVAGVREGGAQAEVLAHDRGSGRQRGVEVRP